MDKAPSIKWRKCQGDFKGGGSIHLGSGNESSHNQGYIVCQIFKDFYGGPYEWLEVSRSQKRHNIRKSDHSLNNLSTIQSKILSPNWMCAWHIAYTTN